MTRITALVLFSLLVCFRNVISQEASGQSMIVSAQWLQEHRNDPDLVILHFANNRRDYLLGHIPGARFLWDGWFAKSNPDLTYELPPVEELVKTVESLGISNHSRIILYYTNGRMTQTARMFVTLDYLGLGARTSILDGGLESWKLQGYPVTQDIPTVQRGSFTPQINPSVVVTGDYVKSNLGNKEISIVDARSPRFFQGDGGGMPRPGHIPGSVNIPYSSIADSLSRFKDFATLKALFEAENIGSKNKVVTYCHIGQQASLLYFVARHLGYDASLYDGSFEDWSGQEDTPVINPSAAKQ